MELRALLLLPLCFPALQAQAPHAEKRQKEGSTLQLRCPYTPEAEPWRKAWCRMIEGQCEVLVLTNIPNNFPFITEDAKGKVTLKDSGTSRILYVTMTNLQVEDSGTYAFVYLKDNSRYIPLKTISLNVFRALQAQAPVAEERWSEGSTLQIQCPYTALAAEKKKGWCRVKNNECELLGEMLDPTQQPHRTRATNGKVTLSDTGWNTSVSITMTNLQVEDSGTYACVYRSDSRWYIPLKTITLRVFTELNKTELDRLSVRCPYSKLEYRRHKAWCRREGRTACKPVVRTDYPTTQSNIKYLEARSTIQDDTQNSTITITMEKLQAQDSGMYWCAFYNAPVPTWIMEISLSVSKRIQQHTAKEMDDVSVQCRYRPTDYEAVSKAWCKEGERGACTVLVTTNVEPQQDRVMIQDDTQQGIVTITMQKLQVQDSGIYWCALDENGQLFRMEEITLNISEVAALPETTPSNTSGSVPPGGTAAPSSNVNTFILLSVVVSILFILALISLIILGIRCHKQLKRRGDRQEEDTYSKPEDATQLYSSERRESPKDDSKDLKYATLDFKPKPKPSPEDSLYCNVEPSQACRKPQDEYVEYAVIALQQLPTNNKG